MIGHSLGHTVSRCCTNLMWYTGTPPLATVAGTGAFYHTNTMPLWPNGPITGTGAFSESMFAWRKPTCPACDGAKYAHFTWLEFAPYDLYRVSIQTQYPPAKMVANDSHFDFGRAPYCYVCYGLQCIGLVSLPPFSSYGLNVLTWYPMRLMFRTAYIDIDIHKYIFIPIDILVHSGNQRRYLGER